MADDAHLFSQIVDTVESFDAPPHPCPSYRTLRDAWWDDVAVALDEIEVDMATEIKVGQYIDCIEDLFNLFVEKASSRAWAARPMVQRLQYAKSLLELPSTAQRSQGWYEQTRNVLTASEFSAILGTTRAVQTLALKKCEKPGEPIAYQHACATAEMGPMDWGVRFEPVVKQILQGLWGADVLDVGRLMHPTDMHLAASPDGLIVAATDEARIGRLVEIKCPVKREINGKIPFEYWCQMQIQMEVTDIDECDYIEVKLASPYKNEAYVPPSEGSVGEKYRGTVWLLQNNETLEMKYAYTQEESESLLGLETGWHVLDTIPWHLAAHFTETVSRDRGWFESTAPKREAFWMTVKDVREGSLVIAPPQKKQAVTVCKIMDD